MSKKKSSTELLKELLDVYESMTAGPCNQNEETEDEEIILQEVRDRLRINPPNQH